MKPQSTLNDSRIIRTILILGMIVFPAVIRIVPHPWNLAPVGAMALFSGATIRRHVLSFLFPLVALFAGDLFIGFHILMPVVYASFIVNIAIGLLLRERRTAPRVAGATLFGAMQFFLVTNFGVWMLLNTYPKTAMGLVDCYLAAVPYLWNTIAGDALYSAFLFGGLALAERCFPALNAPMCEAQ